MRDFIGINGHTVQFRPRLYSPICSLVRDYHPVSWDLGTNTSILPAWPFAKNRVDWNKVYGSWKTEGLRIDVSIMFETIKTSSWQNIEADARAYGQAFAREFGPSSPRNLVESVEVGNEPGEWSDGDYSRIFRAMASGLREGDPKLKIAPCNLTAGKSGRYEKSVDCLKDLAPLYDVLNIHSYAELDQWPTWRRSFPEDPKLPRYLPDIEKLITWRNTHAPGKPIWLTEFGYDSSTKTAEPKGDFSKWIGISDEQQAQWLVRSFLLFSSMQIDRAYLFFFNDDDKPQLHASSGITRHFKPKPSYYALAHLQKTLGNYRFSKIVTNKPGALRIHEYIHEKEAKIIWAGWRPIADNHPLDISLTSLPGQIISIEQMPLAEKEPPKVDIKEKSGQLQVSLTGSVTYLFFEK